MARTFVYILLLQLTAISVCAQQREYFFTHYGKREGLASNEASSIVQDEKGFLWIGTLNGLQRYDGTRFLTFRKGEPASANMPSSYITEMHFDKQQRLWVVFGSGKMGIFDRTNFRYTDVPVETSKPSVLTLRKQLVEDERGNIFLVILGNLFVYDTMAGKFLDGKERIKIPRGWRLSSLLPLPDGNKYYITADSGLAVFNSATGQLSYRNNNVENEPVVRLTQDLRNVGRMLLDSKGRLWLKMQTMSSLDYLIHTIDINRGTVTRHSLKGRIEGSHDLWGFFEASNGTIWLRGFRLLAEFIERDNRFNIVDNKIVNGWGIQFDVTNDLFEDREQNIWVATYSSGIFRFNPGNDFFKSVRYPYGNDKAIFSLAPLNDGGMLISLVNDKLYRYDSLMNNVPVSIPGVPGQFFAYSLLLSNDTRYVLLGGAGVLYVYDQVEKKTKTIRAPEFGNGPIFTTYEDAQGNFWLGMMDKGLFRLSPDGKLTRLTDFPHAAITGYFSDYAGNLWVATFQSGMYKIDPVNNKILKHYDDDGRYSVRCMTSLNDSSLLISSTGLMLFDLARDTIQKLDIGGEMLNSVLSIERDKSGRIWTGLANGLCRVDLQKKSVRHFDRDDGMISDNFWMGLSATMPDGRLAFATDYSYLVFDPQQIEDRAEATIPEYTGFFAANRPLPVDSLLNEKRITLRPSDNSVAIRFSGMSFRKDFKVLYLLEGLDKEWREANELNEAVYNYLPAGTYTFRLKTEDDKGVIAEAPSITIKIKPHFWLTWWFYGILALVVAGIIYWLDKVKQEKRAALQDMRREIAGDLHHEINVTLSNIYMLSEMARLKADSNAPLSKEYIAQIHEKSRTMITAMDDILWSIKPENDSMDKFYRRIRELTGALSKGFDADINLNIPSRVKSLNLDVKHRLLFFLLFKDALQLMVAFGQGKQTEIDIDFMKGELLFRLQDKTAVIAGEDDNITTIISAMQGRVDQLKGELDIQPGPAGVTILFRSPVRG